MLALVAMGLGVLIIANDFTAFSVAIPTMQRDLHCGLSTAQWVINAYAVVFGVAIVTGGRVADLLGRRRVFVAGATLFAVFSLAGGLAPNAPWLIACRAVMGLGGAMVWPAVMGMTYDLLPESKAGLGGGLILGSAGFGNAVGPLIGGLLTDALSWRWIFFVNLPVAAVGVAATLLFVPADRSRQERERLDWPGVATLTVGLVALLLALDLSSSSGWTSPVVLALIILSPVGLFAFAAAERRGGPAALLPGDVVGNRTFVAASLAVLAMSGVFFGILLYVPQLLVRHLGWTPLGAGAGLLPMMTVFAVTSFVAGRLYGRLGVRASATIGAACLTLGIFALTLATGGGYAGFVPGLVVTGVGVGFFYSSVSTAAVTALDPERASLAGGVVYMCQVGGGSIGLAVSTAIVVDAGDTVDALVHGVTMAFTVDAVLAAVATAVTVRFVGTPATRTPGVVIGAGHRAHHRHLLHHRLVHEA